LRVYKMMLSLTVSLQYGPEIRVLRYIAISNLCFLYSVGEKVPLIISRLNQFGVKDIYSLHYKIENQFTLGGL